MYIKLFLVAMLGLSISCFAESEVSQLKPSPEIDQAKKATVEDDQLTRIKTKRKTTESQSSQESGLDKQSLMIDYCRKHTC